MQLARAAAVGRVRSIIQKESKTMADSSNTNEPLDQKQVVVSASDRSLTTVTPFDALQSTTRLLVGLALIGGDELLKRVQDIEQAILTTPPDPAALAEQIRNSPTGQYIPDDVRHALIGLAFDLQAQLRTNLPRFLATGDQIFTSLTQPVQSIVSRIPIVSSLGKSIGLQLDATHRRGEDQLKRWIAIGRREEPRSRVLAAMLYKRILDDYIDFFAEKPEVQNLIMGQATGLTAEVIDEVRETTVSGDSFFEGIVRAVLRKAPRTEVPPPSIEIRQAAVVVPPNPVVKKGEEQ
jgi:hypothetical protein